MNVKKDLSKLPEGERDPEKVKILSGLKKIYNSVPVRNLTLDLFRKSGG